MNLDDQKYLAEKMGITPMRNYPYFDTPYGFFLVFEWAKKQEWWEIFNPCMNDLATGGEFMSGMGLVPVSLIGPRFAEEVVRFLKGKENGKS